MTRSRAPHTKQTPVRTASTILQEVFEDMTARGIRVQDIANNLCKAPTRASERRRGKVEPGSMVVEEMAVAPGYSRAPEKTEDAR